jgi:hypothetical protein
MLEFKGFCDRLCRCGWFFNFFKRGGVGMRIISFIMSFFQGFFGNSKLSITVVSKGENIFEMIDTFEKRKDVDISPLIRWLDVTPPATRGVVYDFILIPAREWCKIKGAERINIDQVFQLAKMKGLQRPNIEATVLLCEKVASGIGYPADITIFHDPISAIRNCAGSVTHIEKDGVTTRILPLVNGSWEGSEYLAFLKPNIPLGAEPVGKTPSWTLGY